MIDLSAINRFAGPAVVAIGLDVLLKATALFVFLWLLASALGRRRPAVGSAVVNAFLLGLILLPLTLFLSPRLAICRLEAEVDKENAHQSHDVVRHIVANDRPEAIGRAASVPSLPVPAQGLEQHPAFVSEQASVSVPEQVLAPLNNSEVCAPGPVVQEASNVLRLAGAGIVLGLAAYALGVALLMARILVDVAAVARLRRSSTPLSDPCWTEALDRWSRRLGRRRGVSLAVSDRTCVPLVIGWLRPVILLPGEWVRSGEAGRRDAILLHELAHVLRADCSWQLALRAVQAIYWVHPLAWVAGRVVRDIRERACDDLCVRWLGGAGPYSRTLLEVAAGLVGRAKGAPGVAMVRSPKLGRRLTHISNSQGATTCLARWPHRAAIAAAVLCATALLGLVGLVAAESTAEQRDSAPSAPADAALPARDSHGDPLPPGAIGRLGALRFQHGDLVHGVGFSGDGKMVVSASAGRICYWESSSGRLLRTVSTGTQRLRAFAISPDGEVAVSVGEDKKESRRTIKFWDVPTGGELVAGTWKGANDPGHLVFSPDGRFVISGGQKGVIRIWDRNLMMEIFSRQLGAGGILALALAPDGETLAISTGAAGVLIWNFTTDPNPRAMPVDVSGSMTLAFSVDGRHLAMSSRSGDSEFAVLIAEVDSGKVVRTLSGIPKENYVNRFAYTPDGKRLLAYSRGTNQVILWDPETGKLLGALDAGPNDANQLVVSPDGRRLATRAHPSTTCVWDLATQKMVAGDLPAHRANVGQLAVLPAGDAVVTAGDDGTARLWDLKTGRQRHVFRHEKWVRAVAASLDGKLVATSSLDNTVRLWDARDGRQLHRLRGHGTTGGCRGLAFTPDGKRLASWGDSDMCLRVWDVTEGKLLSEHVARPSGLEELEAMTFGVSAATLTPDAKRLVVGSLGWIDAFDVDTGKELYRSSIEGSDIRYMAFSPDGKLLLTSERVAGRDATSPLRVREPATGKVLRSIALACEVPGSVAFSADGKTVAAVDFTDTGKIYLVDVATGKEIGALESSRGRVASLAFTRDGKRLVSGMWDGTALIWDVSDLSARREFSVEIPKPRETVEKKPPIGLSMQPMFALRLKELTGEGKTVLVFFTADFCPNAPLVRRTALDTVEVCDLVKKNRVVAALADLSDNLDEEAQAWMKVKRSVGVVSIPAVIVFPAGGAKEPIALSASITEEDVLQALTIAGPSKR